MQKRRTPLINKEIPEVLKLRGLIFLARRKGFEHLWGSLKALKNQQKFKLP